MDSRPKMIITMNNMSNIPILFDTLPQDWSLLLTSVLSAAQLKSLSDFVLQAYEQTQVYPAREHLFTAFAHTPFEQVKVVILGQDPYHGPGQAHGMSFSVPDGMALPPSLRNIYKELADDLGVAMPTSGNLSYWAQQGVLLLNTVLTVQAAQAGSHRKRGWEFFTDHVIQSISQHKEHVVFVLWGKDAQSKRKLIDNHKHLLLESVHPSPLSAYNGFWGSKPFSQINQALQDWQIAKIDWTLEKV